MTDIIENAPLPVSVDLRSNIEQVYNQSNTEACLAHAPTNALDAFFDNIGQSKRVSRAWIWWWIRENSGRAGLNVGGTFNNLKYALEEKGIVLESEHPWTSSAFNPPPSGLTDGTIKGISFVPINPDINNIKRKLALGIPTVIGITIHQDFYSLFGQTNWRTNQWNINSADTMTDHAVCIVGYDDNAGRFLVENSWGPSFADGGFFGIPYTDFHRVRKESWSIDRIYGYHPKKVETYVSIPYLLDPADSAAFTARSKTKLIQLLTDALNTGGMQAVLDVCKEWAITDKHLEHLFSWQRGNVRIFQEANPGLNWTGFYFTDM